MKKGGGFEKVIEHMLWAIKQGLIEKVDPPVRIIKPLGKGQYHTVFTKKGALDFAGPFRGSAPDGGRHVEFDVKDTKTKRFAFTMIKPHQWERLLQLDEAHAWAGVVLRMRAENANDDRIFGIPACVLLSAREAGKKSFSMDDFEDLIASRSVTEISYGKPNLLLDFILSIDRVRST